MRDPSEQPRQIDMPKPGFFEMRLVKGGALVPCRIDFDGERWSAWIDGVLQMPTHRDPGLASGVFRIWHGASRVSQAQHDFRIATKAWAQEHDVNHPSLKPAEPIDLSRRRAVF